MQRGVCLFTLAAAIRRQDYAVALNPQISGPDPDPILQWREGDPERRKPILWEIERKLAADDARPIIFYPNGGSCRQPFVKGPTIMVDSVFSGWRQEDGWLDR